MRCLRCDFRTDPALDEPGREQLAEHALTSGHPLCVVCHRSLSPEDTQTCEQCLTESRSLLAGILLMFDDLDGHIGHLPGQAYDRNRGTGDGKPLPGGDVLTLLSGGSHGGAARRLTPLEAAQPERWWIRGGIGPLTQAALMQAERERTGREHQVDNQPTDAPSVAYALTSWEQDWRDYLNDADANPAHTTTRIAHRAAGYLEVHARWAAREHPAFDEYHADLRGLHTRLESVTGNDSRRVTADAECFGCGAGALVREVRDGKPCHHDTATLPLFPGEFKLDDDGNVLLNDNKRPIRVPIRERRARYELALDAWEQAHGRCQQQGGYADVWTCQRCNERYDWQRYLLAVKAKVRGTPAGDWSLPAHVALVLDVPVQTVLTWAKRGLVATACIIGDRRMRVAYEDVAERIRRRPKRRAS